MEKVTGRENRLLWMDVLRGILILSVVIGHATSQFNAYIYQFHMGAFFLVSGYMAHPEKRTVVHTVYHRFLTVFLPLVTAGVLLWLVTMGMHAANVYSLFFSEQLPFFKASQTAIEFLKAGSIYVWWLGAGWFVMVLFGCSVLNRLVFQLCGKKCNIGYFLTSLILFLLGYSAAQSGAYGGNWDLILIAQFYYGMGVATQKHQVLERLAKRSVFCAAGAAATMGVSFFGSRWFGLTMDWPSRRFNLPVADCFIVLNGLLFVFFLSVFLKELPVVRQVLSYLGKNTLPIVFFHFMWFNAGFALLYWAGKAPLSVLQNFTPPSELAGYWWLFVLTGTGGSVLLWELVQRSKLLCIVFGQEKALYDRGYEALRRHAGFQKTEAFLETGLDLLCADRREILKRSWKKVKQHRFACLVVVLFLLAVLIPWYQEGIMCNDELQHRLLSLKGFPTFFKSYVAGQLRLGRVLGAPFSAVSSYLGLLGQSPWTYKLLQIVMLMLTVYLFCGLIHRIFANKSFTLLCALSLVAFLPISFEHTPPNAFIASFPLFLLFWSMNLYWDWLKTKANFRLVASMLLLLLMLCNYEAFVTFVPVYVLLAIYQRGLRQSLRKCKELAWPVGVGIFYVALYILSGRLFPSQYAGNRLILPDPLNALKIIVQLVRTAFPGYYLTSSKHAYLMLVYQDISVGDVARLLLVGGAFSTILYSLLRRCLLTRETSPLGKGHSGWIVLSTLVVITLPTLPLAMAEMYQTAIGGNGFLALPVSFFMYFPATFLCCFLLWQLCGKLFKNNGWKIAGAVVIIAMVSVQLMNGEFSARHAENFQRLETMEHLMKTSAVQGQGTAIICAPDLFETRDALAIHDGYWTDYAATVGAQVQIVNQEGNTSENRIYFDDERFDIWCGQAVCVLSKGRLSGIGAVQYLEDVFLAADFSFSSWDGTWQLCYFTYQDGKLIPSSAEAFAAAQARLSIGTTLASAVKENGYFQDGWLEKESRFQIRSSDVGMLHVELYQPKAAYQAMNGVVTIQGKAHDFTLTGESTALDLPVAPNTILDVTITMNQDFEAGGGDLRRLSVVLSDLYGQ